MQSEAAPHHHHRATVEMHFSKGTEMTAIAFRFQRTEAGSLTNYPIIGLITRFYERIIASYRGVKLPQKFIKLEWTGLRSRRSPKAEARAR